MRAGTRFGPPQPEWRNFKRNVGQAIDIMHAGWLRLGRLTFGAGLTALAAFAAFAPVQPAYAAHGGGFQRAPAGRPMMGQAMRPMAGGAMAGGAMRGGSPWAGYRVNRGGFGSGRPGIAPMRVADQGGWRGRGGNPLPVRSVGGGFGGYRNGPITPVSAQTRSVPHPPADSPVRAGSIREDVARYNEERGAFRPVQQRSGGEVPRPPMPSPYRN